MKKIDGWDQIIAGGYVTGVALVAVGIWLMHMPSALIFLGLTAIGAAFLMDKD